MKRFYFASAVVILFVLALPAVSFASNWPSQKLNSQNNPVSFDSATYNNSSSYKIQTVFGSSANAYPISAEGKLFYTVIRNSTDVTLFAADLNNGQTIWSKNFNRQILNIAYESGKLYFGSGIIYCLDANTGSTLWSVDRDLTGNLITTSRVYKVVNSIIYANEVHGSMGDSEVIILNNSGQAISDLNHFRTTRIIDVLLDNANFYLINDGSFQAQTTVSAFNISDKTLVWQQGCKAGASAMLDNDLGRIYVTSSSYACGINTNGGQKIFDGDMGSYYGFAKYGNRIYASAYMSMISFPSNFSGGNFDYGDFPFKSPERFSSAPIIVNDTIYYGSSLGRVWGKNLETGESSIWSINAAGGYIDYLACANGKLIIVNRLSQPGSEMIVKDINEMSLRPGNYSVTLDSPYKTDGYNPYLGQLHAHYRPEDPFKWLETYNLLPTAADVEERYKKAGYDFVALTEHNEIIPDPGVLDLLHISNAEEITPDGKGGHILGIGLNNLIDFALPDQDRINGVLSQNGIPILAHPNSDVYTWSSDSLMTLQRYNHIEIFNGSGRFFSVLSPVIGDYYATDRLDILSSERKTVYGTAGDDYTPGDGGFDQAAVTVFSKTSEQNDILQNLQDGNFYARQGSSAPNISVSISGPTIFVSSDKISEIKFIGDGGRVLKNELLTNSSSYMATGDEKYVRAEVTCANGIDLRTSWTQPIRVNKTRNSQTSSSNFHYSDLGQGGLTSNTTAPVNTSILPASDYPNTTPPLGYLSPVYSFSTTGQVLDGTNLSISYADKGVYTSPNNLAVYTYNESSSAWEKVESQVDASSQTVSANLSHFSLYTLSAEQPADTEKPTVTLASPTDLSNLSGNIKFVAEASDNNAVTKVRFSIDNKDISKDLTKDDEGWTKEINGNDYAVGDHNLKIEAEDFSGNIGALETTISIIESNFIAPTITINSPAESQYLNTAFNISGSYSSQNDLQSISIFIDDIYIADADFADGVFQKEIDFSQFKEGQHQLKIVLKDSKDNTAETARTINVGEELKVNIVSPQEKTYMHSELIKFQYQSVPAYAEGVTAKLDGKEIANNSMLNAFDLALGEHKLTVKKNGKIYAERNLTISTNLIDQIRLTQILYQTGHIKNNGIKTSIQAHLLTAEIFELLHMTKMRNQFIQKAIDFINKQNKQKKPLIDNHGKEILIADLNYLLAR